MGFSIFLYVCNILIPVIMVVFGTIFGTHIPKKINTIYGYRTTRSMKNQDTWQFAHKYWGGLWIRLGIIVLIPSVLLSLLFFYFPSKNAMAVFSLVTVMLQTIVLVISIVPVEKALKRTFDENGIRREV